MNNVTINWKRIYSTFPEKDNILDTKGWTRQEIAAMLGHAQDPMDRAIILLLASSGVRLSGLNLTWGRSYPDIRREWQADDGPGRGLGRGGVRRAQRVCRVPGEVYGVR